jgi:CheY-like chemotaxis protein
MGKKIILLIEDDLAIIDVYKTGLEKAGKFKVEAITLGSEAIERIKSISENKSKKPDLVLLDIILPDINGIKILESIRNQEKTKDIPVFVLTNYGGKKFKKEGLALNAEEYIIKTDCPPSKLTKLIKKRLK